MREFRLSYFSLYTTWIDIKKNIVFILLAMWIGFSGCRVYCTYFEKNQYQSSMVVAVNIGGYNSRNTTGSLSDSISLANVIFNVFDSETLKKVVQKQTGKPLTSGISVSQMQDTNFVSIVVKAYDPQSSYNDLIAIKNGYKELTDTVLGNVTLSTVKSPAVSFQKANRKRDLILEIEYSIIFGAISLLIIVIMSYFRDTVKNESDIENLLDSELFETVYDEKIKSKEKIQLSIANRNTSYLFNYSFNKMAIKLESLKRTKNIKSILVTSVFENEGKTTVAANMAMALAQEGCKVLILDSDFKNPSLRKIFANIPDDKKINLVDYIKGKATLDEVIVHDKQSKVDVICNFKSQRKSTEYLRENSFTELLKTLEEMYDFVIIDSPPVGLVSDTEILKEYVTSVMFVIAQDYSEVGAIVDAMDNFDTEKIIGCIFNRVGQFKRQLKDKLQSNY